jgi:glycosyltransferase involved in cell wall biosynthesis
MVSVVVPTLNEEKLLAHTLSAFSPELRARYHTELIVSDGGSTDATLEIAAAHADRIVTEEPGRKQNIAQGRNRGADVANGQVIVFINGDTVPENIERFMDTVSRFAARTGTYATASALATPVNFPVRERRPADVLFHAFYNGYVWLLNAMRIGAGRGECQIVRTTVFRAVNGYRENLAAGEDFDLYARISRRARVRFAPELLVLESPRRFRKFGYFRVLFWWTVNALSVMVRGRSSSDEWEPVR